MNISATKVTGKVVGVIRHGHTVYGNPTMSVRIAVESVDGTPTGVVQGDGTTRLSPILCTIRIQDNSGLVYGIENAEYRDEVHEYTLTKAGRVRTVQRV